MVFQGENFALTPKTSQLGFVFDGLSLSNGNGTAEIGFSGEGKTSSFFFSGRKLMDLNGNYVYSYEPNSSIGISGDIKGNVYRYFIDGSPIGDGLTQPNSFTIEKFFAKTTDCSLTTNVVLSCPKIDYKISFASSFVAGKLLSGKIENNSAIDFKILGSYFSKTQSSPSLSGLVTGDVSAHSALDFTLEDISESFSSNTLNSILNLRTTIGTITVAVDSERLSGSAGTLTNFDSWKNVDPIIAPYFSGSGNAAKFHWLQYEEQKESYSLSYESYDERGVFKEKPLKVTLENVSPESGVYYTGVYVDSFFTYFSGHDYCITGQECSNTQYTTQATCEAAGSCDAGGHTTEAACEGAGQTWTFETWDDLVRPIWQCSGKYPGSGRYSELPTIRFLDYSKITGATFNTNNLLTKDSPEKIPILFSGYTGEFGTGASGYFLTEAFQIDIKNYLPQNHTDNTPDGSNTIDWRRVTGVEITSQGTGYTKMPLMFMATGTGDDSSNDSTWDNTLIGGTGYDVGKRRSPYVFEGFEAQALGEYTTDSLTGLSFFEKDGNDYLFSGVLITNPGSGYDPDIYKPEVRLIRHVNDSFGTGTGDNASGEFLFNKSGHFYEFDKHWDITTGVNLSGGGLRFGENNMFIDGEKYSGSMTLPDSERSFFIDVHFKNSSIDEPMVSKLYIEGENAFTSTYLITGQNIFSQNTGLGYYVPTPLFDGQNFFNTNYFGS